MSKFDSKRKSKSKDKMSVTVRKFDTDKFESKNKHLLFVTN